MFGATAADDTTGVQLWAASLVFGWWLIELRERVAGRSVMELGAGCGLPGLLSAAYLNPASVVMSDFYSHTVDNLKENIKLNAALLSPDAVTVELLDWLSPGTWPATRYQVILACDLVYHAAVVSPLAHVIDTLLAPAGMLYLVHSQHRLGADSLPDELRKRGFTVRTTHPAPTIYKRNPFVSNCPWPWSTPLLCAYL